MRDSRYKSNIFRSADPLADDLVHKIIGPWPDTQRFDKNDPAWKGLAEITRYIHGVKIRNSGEIETLRPIHNVSPRTIKLTNDFIARGAYRLPDWADRDMIDRGAQFAVKNGREFCVSMVQSLVETYAHKPITLALEASGDLEGQTKMRIRNTASMVLPVIMPGGITDPDKAGIHNLIVTRLMHAMVRNLILRGHPDSADSRVGDSQIIPKIDWAKTRQDAAPNLLQSFYINGWDYGSHGIPNNRADHAYVLLAFNLTISRSMKKLGVVFTQDDENDFFHLWNAAGHVMGQDDGLMAWTYEQGEKLFSILREGNVEPANLSDPADPRPVHIQALIKKLSDSMDSPSQKAYPQLLVRLLSDEETLKALGMPPVEFSRAGAAFNVGISTAKVIDSISRSMGLYQPLVGEWAGQISEPMVEKLIGQDAGIYRELVMAGNDSGDNLSPLQKAYRASLNHVAKPFIARFMESRTLFGGYGPR